MPSHPLSQRARDKIENREHLGIAETLTDVSLLLIRSAESCRLAFHLAYRALRCDPWCVGGSHRKTKHHRLSGSSRPKTNFHSESTLHAPMMPRIFDAVTDLLQDTIDRSAKSQSDADGELAWLRNRLENERHDQHSRGKEVHDAGDIRKPREFATQTNVMTGVLGGKENSSLMASAGPRACEVPSGMSVLQLRRFLRAIGQPTVGLKAVLISRLNKAISSGVVKSFVESFKGGKADNSIICAGERRKRDAMLALADSMLGSNKANSEVAAPRQPLRESASAASDRNSRSSACSASGKPGPKLSGPEQDAVLAKIRSAAKRSASPEKKLPFQDDDTPTTKGLRLKKEMEDRLQRQNQLLSVKKQTDSSAKLTAPSPSTPPLVRTPGQQPGSTTNQNQTSPAMSTPPSVCPPVLSSPPPMPLPSSTRAAVTPPPPTSDAPRPAFTPPAPVNSAPRAADIAKSMPAKPSEPSHEEDTASGDYVESSAASRPLPTNNVAKASAAVEAAPEAVSKVVAPKGGGDKSVGDTKTGGDKAGASAVPVAASSSANKGFGSPGRFRTPNAKTPARKTNAFAKDSISTTGPSGLKVAAHKALHRVAVKPSAPSAAAKEISTPTGNSTTKDAFAKFRAMDSAKKGGPTSSFKPRQTPGKAKAGNNPTMPPPQNQKHEYNNFGFSKAAASSQYKREAQEAQTAASNRAAQLAQVEAAAADSRNKAASAAEKERERARAKAAAEARREAQAAADKEAADEARREAQAAAEAKAREAAFKAAAERKVKDKVAEAAKRKEAELKKRKEEEKQAAVAEALRQAELKRKAEDKKAAEAEAAATAAAAAATVAMAVARKEEQAALAQKRAQQQKPPTPPRPPGKAPPTPPRPSHQTGAPTPPPRPNSIQVHLQEKAQAHVQSQGHGQSSMAASSRTPPKTPYASSPGTVESNQLALAKKKEEIKERMDMVRQNNASQAQKHHASQAPKHHASQVQYQYAAQTQKQYAAQTQKQYPAQTQKKYASQAQQQHASTAPKTAPVVKAPVALKPAPAPSPAPLKSVPKEDRESYDDYDVEPESESESGDEGGEQAQDIPEPQEPTDKSGIPEWARGPTLASLLDRQYGGPNPINPDTIFPEFFTCNLEHIFNTKKSKWDRTSSGNWHTDRLTIAEKLAYQRAMGFDS